MNPAPGVTTVDVPEIVHPAKAELAGAVHVFVFGEYVTLYVAWSAVGAVPVPVPQLYVTLYLFAVHPVFAAFSVYPVLHVIGLLPGFGSHVAFTGHALQTPSL